MTWLSFIELDKAVVHVISWFFVILISVCLPSDALSQCLPSYWGFSYLGHGVSLHSCSSKEQLLLLTLDIWYLLSVDCRSSTTQPPFAIHVLDKHKIVCCE